jgi:hypothetical protein
MFDGETWHTRAAESADGIQWRDPGKVPTPDPATWESCYIAANGSALFYGGQIWYRYEAGARERLRIGLRGQAVMEPGPWGSWDERAVADPDRVLVWFGGGDVARMDENIHGQIGFGVLRPVSATLEK